MSWGARGQRTRAYARPPKARKKKNGQGRPEAHECRYLLRTAQGAWVTLYIAPRECKERNDVTSQLACTQATAVCVEGTKQKC